MPITAIIDRVQVICATGVIDDVVLDKLVLGEPYTWHEIAGVNRTGGTTTIEIGLKHGGEFFAYRSLAPAAANRIIRLQTHIMGPGDFVPCARFRGAGIGDTLELTVNGHVGHI